jgi:hypothetical protein
MKKNAGFTTLLLIGVAQLLSISIAQGQQRSESLGQAWSDGNKNFTLYSWLRAEDESEIYSSPVYTEINQNTLNVHNTYRLDPFGKNARCGGLGCDLGKGQLIATLRFDSKGDSFLIKEASGNAAFLKGSQCRLIRGYVQVLECTSTQNPSGSKMPSIFRFSPGS